MADENIKDRMRHKLLGRKSAWNSSQYQLTAPTLSGLTKPGTKVALASTLLGKDERGAVWTDIPCAWFPDDDSLDFNGTPAFAEEVFRSSLIFYDRFDYPIQTLVEFPSPAVKEIKSLGILQQSMPELEASIPAFRRHAFDTFLALDNREPHRWTMARPAQALGIPDSELSTAQGFDLTLKNALPIFAREVPLTEVMEFKLKRLSEIRALRGYLDELIIDVSRNGSNSLEETVAFDRFDRALADHMKVMVESNRARIMMSFRQSISWEVLGTPALEAILNHTISAAGILGPAITIGINTAKGLRRKRGTSPFEYLTSANLELY